VLASARAPFPRHIPDWVGRAVDLGPLADDEPVTHVYVALARTTERQQAWDDLLLAQVTPGSPRYHAWLTPPRRSRSSAPRRPTSSPYVPGSHPTGSGSTRSRGVAGG
jgi:hypothetical protein